jgi:hypothetical protein
MRPGAVVGTASQYLSPKEYDENEWETPSPKKTIKYSDFNSWSPFNEPPARYEDIFDTQFDVEDSAEEQDQQDNFESWFPFDETPDRYRDSFGDDYNWKSWDQDNIETNFDYDAGLEDTEESDEEILEEISSNDDSESSEKNDDEVAHYFLGPREEEAYTPLGKSPESDSFTKKGRRKIPVHLKENTFLVKNEHKAEVDVKQTKEPETDNESRVLDDQKDVESEPKEEYHSEFYSTNRYDLLNNI